MAPQVAVGGWTPRPKKLSVASESTAAAMPMAACTSRGCRMLGRMWRSHEVEVGGSHGAGGLHVLALLDGEDLGSD